MSKDNFTEQGVAPYGMRHGTITPKGKGFFGDLKRPDGDSSTELSSEFEYEGKKVEYPLIVPTLSKAELDILLKGEQPTDEIYDKAESWAKSRINKGMSPFASSMGNEKFPVPEASNKFAEGGMASNDMNRLFAEGGMNDEGGTVDPVSGNDVPTGSLQNEVRDDIPAQLSEGEFVVPADVVRYIGLERLMKLRDEAKAGLARMNEIGQMGNADQVENPEALHEGDEGFESEIDDIMQEVESQQPEENNYAVGGAVKVPPADKDILAKYNIQRTSITNPALDVRLLKNAAGDSLYMTYFNGKPGGVIPEGYSVVDANPASRMAGATTTTTVNKVADSTATVDSGNKTITTVGGDTAVGNVGNVNNTSMVDLALANVPVTGKDGKVTTPTDTTTTDGGLGVNFNGTNYTSNADGGVSTGIGGYTLNPDGTVTANKVNQGLTAVAGIVNPILGIAARVNNALATSAAKDFTTAIADTMGVNVDYRSATNTAGPTGSGVSAAAASTTAASTATSLGLSATAAGAAGQAAADVITKGGTADAAAEAGRAAAADVTRSEQSSTDTTASDATEAKYRESLGDFNELDTGFSGSSSSSSFSGGSSAGSKGNIEDYNILSLAKGGLVAKRTKKPTLAQKRGIASKK